MGDEEIVFAAESVTKTFGDRAVIRGVSLSMKRGEKVALVGPNGAGKTTLFYILLGLAIADSGRVSLGGRDITRLPLFARARMGLSYLPQEAHAFPDLTVENNLRVVLQYSGRNRDQQNERLEYLLEKFSIANLRNHLASVLSGGQRRRMDIARALCSDPIFVLLDEPFAGVDPVSVNEVMQLIDEIAELGIGVLISDHNVQEVFGIVDRAYVIADGTVVAAGAVDEVAADPLVRRIYLGNDFAA